MMRSAFVRGLRRAMIENPDVILLYGDVAAPGFAELALDNPGRVVNVGVIEQAMMGVAAGMAMNGLCPVVYSILPFVLERCYEQIKLDVDLQNQRVVIVGYDHPGPLGPTHRPLDELALLRTFRNVRTRLPRTLDEAQRMTAEALGHFGPSFLILREP